MLRVCACLAICLVAAACTTGSGGQSSPSDARDSLSATSLPAGASISGVLGADSIEGGCPYLEADDGTRYEVLYPNGWRVDRGSGALHDPSGRLVAGAGERITVRGTRANDVASTCQIGPIFRATEVTTGGD